MLGWVLQKAKTKGRQTEVIWILNGKYLKGNICRYVTISAVSFLLCCIGLFFVAGQIYYFSLSVPQKKKKKNIKHSNLMFVWNSTNAIFGQRLEILEQNGSSTESRPVCSITFSETTAKKHWHLIPLPNDQHRHLFGCSCNLLILTRHFQQVNVSVRLPPVGG